MYYDIFCFGKRGVRIPAMVLYKGKGHFFYLHTRLSLIR